MSYLLDTNVVSELRRQKPHGGVLAWLATVPRDSLFISAVTFGELERGVERTRERDPAKASEIEAWMDRLAAEHAIVPMDARAFRVWSRLMHKRRQALIEDAMIAATALVHGMVVVTRNVRDFDELGVRAVNPFSAPQR